MTTVAGEVTTTSDLVRRILVQAETPLSAAQILEKLPKSVRPSLEELEGSLRQDGIWEYAASRGKGTWLDREPRQFAQQQMRQRMQRGPMTRSEVVAGVAGLKSLGLLGRKGVEAAFDDLARSGQIHKLTPYLGARTALYSLEPAKPHDYLRHAVAKLAAKLSVSPSALADAMPQVVTELSEAAASSRKRAGQREADEKRVEAAEPVRADRPADRILQGIHDINGRAADGDFVLLSELRQRLDWQVDKGTFDAALLELAAEGRIALHESDRSGTLTEAEREALVADGSGRHFNAVSLRREA